MAKYLQRNNLKIAIFYDWLTAWGGAERLLLLLLKYYPQAVLYTSTYAPENTKWLPKNINIKYIYQLPKFLQNKESILAPFMPVFLERYNFDEYDVLLSMGSIYPHCLLTKPDTKYLCYLLTPNRYLYKLKSKIPAFFRKLDSIYIKRPDQILTISQTTASRINNNYHINPKIIYPGIDTDFFVPESRQYSSNYYLCVSRLVPYKKIDLAIKACGELNQPLKIVGRGRSLEKLKLLAKSYSNISFEGEISNFALRQLYQNCKALISPQLEDFGLVNLEVQACGKPVIAFNKGGNTETIVNGKTGIFFNQQNVASLKQAILDFEQKIFLVSDCREQALKFGEKSFVLNLTNTIHDSTQKPKTTG